MSTTGKLFPLPDGLRADDQDDGEVVLDGVIDRPFDPAILERAIAAVEHYRVTMWFEDGEFYAFGVELPGAGGDGPTPDACMAAAREAMVAVAACMLEAGEALPVSVTQQEQAAFDAR
jgi:predicted RNase H-like HicB family nuclease